MGGPKRHLPQKSVLDEAQLLAFLDREGLKPVHARTIWRHVLKTGGVGCIADVADLPHRVYERLPAEFGDSFVTSTLLEERHSSDGTTTKLLFEMQDGLRVESVIMRYDSSLAKRSAATTSETGSQPDVCGNKRATLCVSSQVGCAMGCTFCATGTMGIIGDLTSGEILEQLLVANRVTRIRNVVFMGMGEPLNNYPQVAGAVRAMIDPQRFGLAGMHVTVSTVGVIPAIRKLAEDFPSVNFALSLHAPTQQKRLEIVPSAQPYPLDKLMAAVDEHHRITGRGCFVEYVMLNGVNDQIEQARQLAQLLVTRREHVHVNLIPWNPMLAKDGAEPYDAPNPDNIETFHQILKASGIPCTVRMTMGQDIDGACGQLALEKGVKKSSGDRDIEDMVPTRGRRSAGRTQEAATTRVRKANVAHCDDAPVRVVSGRMEMALDAVRVFVALSGPAAIACSLLLRALRARR